MVLMNQGMDLRSWSDSLTLQVEMSEVRILNSEPPMETLPSCGISPAAELGPAARLLITGGKDLSPVAKSQILALGQQAIPQLMDVLRDHQLAKQDAPGEGWAPVHAVRLLGELRAVAAVEPMLDLLDDSDGGDYLSAEIIEALPAMGPPVLERLLQAQPRFERADQMNPLNVVLAKLGTKDPRILAILLDELKKFPDIGASNLAVYGDPAALPHLLRAFDEYQVTPTDNPIEHHAMIELTAAIEELGGDLTPAQQAKAQIADEPRRRFAELLTRLAEHQPTGGTARRKVGRNEPCPCGSGKKYKKCHLLLEN